MCHSHTTPLLLMYLDHKALQDPQEHKDLRVNQEPQEPMDRMEQQVHRAHKDQQDLKVPRVEQVQMV